MIRAPTLNLPSYSKNLHGQMEPSAYAREIISTALQGALSCSSRDPSNVIYSPTLLHSLPSAALGRASTNQMAVGGLS